MANSLDPFGDVNYHGVEESANDKYSENKYELVVELYLPDVVHWHYCGCYHLVLQLIIVYI